MKADPDFHPIASAWLDGTATPPEQRLLSEILHTDGNVEEYAALCRTEALLQQTGRTAAERRKSLAAMLSGKPWPQRAVLFLKSRPIRWAAAAAVVAIGAWALWPAAAPEESQTVRKNRVPRLTEAPTARDASSPTAREAPLPPAADGLEQRLRRYYVANFKATAPLPEAAAALAAAITPGSDYALTADVRDSGDAPVHLQFSLALPAWTLLELMALQSGTEFRLSGHSLVFRTARTPVPTEGTLTRTAELTPIGSLLGIQAEDQSDMLMFFGASAQVFLGSRIEFRAAPENSVSYTGRPRDVRVLEKSLSATPEPPLRVRLTMIRAELPAGSTLLSQTPPIDEPSPGLRGLFTAEQFKVVLENLRTAKDVNTFQPASKQPRPGELAKFQSHTSPNNVGASLEAVPSEDGTSCDLQCVVGPETAAAAAGGPALAGSYRGSLLLFSGQTVAIGGFPTKDGGEIVLFFTADVISVHEALLAGDSGSAAPTGTGEPEELLYGIPVVGEKGKVYSPYAPEKGLVDVEGLPRGTRAACPYTGKHFRVP